MKEHQILKEDEICDDTQFTNEPQSSKEQHISK